MTRQTLTIGAAVVAVVIFLFSAAITTVAARRPILGQPPGGDCTGPISPTGWTRTACGPIGSGFRTPVRPGHDGIDIMASNGSTVRAAVSLVTCNAHLKDGTPYSCDVPGSRSVRGCGW